MRPSNVIVYGAGGHGKVVCELVQSTGAAVVGFLDDGVAAGTLVLGLPVLAWSEAVLLGATIALGVGSNRARRTVFEKVSQAGFPVGTFVHERAVASPSATLAVGVVLMAGAVVNAEARLGVGVIVNSGAVVEHECQVGDFAHICPRAALGGGVLVGAGSQVGLGASVRPFARIGQDCVIGAGAVVLSGVDDSLVVAGVPARPLRRA